MSTKRAGCREIHCNLPNELFDAVEAARGKTHRSHWLIEAVEDRLRGTGGNIARENYPRATAKVLQITSGKLSRLEADHVVAAVITALSNES